MLAIFFMSAASTCGPSVFVGFGSRLPRAICCHFSCSELRKLQQRAVADPGFCKLLVGLFGVIRPPLIGRALLRQLELSFSLVELPACSNAAASVCRTGYYLYGGSV